MFNFKARAMKTYEVVIESVGRKTIIVEAENADDAQDFAWDQWDGSTDGYADNSILSTEEVTA
jgi:hypothetical protein